PTATRPSATICSAARREATPAWARRLASLTAGVPGNGSSAATIGLRPPLPPALAHGPQRTRHDPRRARRAALPRPPGVGVDGPRRRGLRGDDRSARRAPRAARRAPGVLLARAAERGGLARRDRQGALPHRRRPAPGGGPDALPPGR